MIPFATGDILTSHELADIIKQMDTNNKFRQLMVIVEACYGGAMGSEIKTPDVLFFSGATGQEVSYGANYNAKIDQWLADNFTYKFLEEIRRKPDQHLDDFYTSVYQNVAGSHVTLLNYENFSNLKETPISDFFTP